MHSAVSRFDARLTGRIFAESKMETNGAGCLTLSDGASKQAQEFSASILDALPVESKIKIWSSQSLAID